MEHIETKCFRINDKFQKIVSDQQKEMKEASKKNRKQKKMEEVERKKKGGHRNSSEVQDKLKKIFENPSTENIVSSQVKEENSEDKKTKTCFVEPYEEEVRKLSEKFSKLKIEESKEEKDLDEERQSD